MMQAMGGRTVHLDVADTTLRYALAYACDEAGWSRALDPHPGAGLVGDRVPPSVGQAVLDVLVVQATPLACRRGLEAFSAGTVRALVSAAEPEALPQVLELRRTGVSAVPSTLVDAALRFPLLRPRLERTLQLVVRGSSVAAISRALHQSQSSTKRDVGELLRLFDAPTRLALAATAVRLGVPPH
jgi:DNA-binding NarL/FixJ family response regulator